MVYVGQILTSSSKVDQSLSLAPTSTREGTPSLSPDTCIETTTTISKSGVLTIDGLGIKMSSLCAKSSKNKATIYLEVKGFEFVDFVHYDIALFQTNFFFFLIHIT
jgi:hypothetical protein